MAATDFDVDSLRRRLNTLPQEIFDLIYNDTFTASNDVRHLDHSSIMRHNLKLLHVSSASRTQYAASYYGQGAIFEEFGWRVTGGMIPWLIMLPETHRALLHRIIVNTRSEIVRDYDAVVRHIRRMVKSDVGGTVHTKVFIKAQGVLYGE